jgi:hypothetical protein
MQHLGVDLADIERTLLIRRAQLANTASWIFNIVCLVVVLGGFAYFLSVQYTATQEAIPEKRIPFEPTTWYSATRNLRAEEYGRQLEPFEIETRYGIQGSDNGRGYQAV